MKRSIDNILAQGTYIWFQSKHHKIRKMVEISSSNYSPFPNSLPKSSVLDISKELRRFHFPSPTLRFLWILQVYLRNIFCVRPIRRRRMFC